MTSLRTDRLITDSFLNAAQDASGIDRALRTRRPYSVPLNGIGFNSLSATFNSLVNFFTPPRYFDDFEPEDIMENKAFRDFRDTLNDRGLDIGTTHNHYFLFVSNKRYGYGAATPRVTFPIVPWDGIKREFKQFDVFSLAKPRQLDF